MVTYSDYSVSWECSYVSFYTVCSLNAEHLENILQEAGLWRKLRTHEGIVMKEQDQN